MGPSLFELGYGKYKILDLLKDLTSPMTYKIIKKDILKKNSYSRKICSREPWACLSYSLYSKEGPHPITRKGASKSYYYSYLYAVHIDKGPHKVTRKGAYRDLYWKTKYIEKFGE